MDRSEVLDMMAALQLSGMRAAYDEIRLQDRTPQLIDVFRSGVLEPLAQR